jgi:hypothetical protein
MVSTFARGRPALRHQAKLQNAWIEIIRREGVHSLVLLEEINGCPHQEGIDYPLGEECPLCPFWAHRERPIDSRPTITGGPVAVANYRPDQWEALLASADDRANLEETWEQAARLCVHTKSTPNHPPNSPDIGLSACRSIVRAPLDWIRCFPFERLET